MSRRGALKDRLTILNLSLEAVLKENNARYDKSHGHFKSSQVPQRRVKNNIRKDISNLKRQVERVKADAKDVDIWLNQIYTNRIREYPTYEQQAHKVAQEGIAKMNEGGE
ncbi:59ccbf1b-7110-4747-be1e-f1bc9f6d2fb6-CDS [Sclerotinia trifoliorum]|uniref:59ccbf1b-7110-4747-be1e-f1bc9f6d2fb6-CDS n=1 Tax=Sclerotinia trifoliorum TaxID=28548 RepID=A0A8H2ZMS4_9HELO|nr:59ccbf1b-7110-4747-be1e-f1bc9f6d2fb6-CDS [Sclerotinia trifoliorum]